MARGKPKSEITEAQWRIAIEKAGGVTEGIAKILKISRTTVWRRAKEEPWIGEAIKEQLQVCIDIALMGVRKHLDDQNPKMIMWYLDRKGKDLGFGKSVDVNANVHAQAQIVLYLPDDGREAKPIEPQRIESQ